MEPASRHQCLVYGGPPSRHLPALAQALRQKLTENYRCLYFNSPPMVAGLRSYLAAAGVDVQLELKKGGLLLSADQGHLIDGSFHAGTMLDGLESAIRQALTDGYAGLFAAGDMTWELGQDRDIPKLVRYEWELERLFHKYPALSGICMYHSDTLPLELIKHGTISHGSVFVNETLSLINPHHAHATAPREIVATLNAEVEAFLLRVMPETAA
jgi:MEDS: MEthanogen/methylotroph, DcmR Sensory domain